MNKKIRSLSFPRRRESFYRHDWIPAFAGMTILLLTLSACGEPPSFKPLNDGSAIAESSAGADANSNAESGSAPSSASSSATGSSSGSGSGSGSSENAETSADIPRPSALVINEVLYDAAGVDTNGDCFIELVGDAGGYLKGYHLALVNGDDGKTYKSIPIDGEYFVGDDGFFLIADVDSANAPHIEGADININFDPQNGPDSIQLIGADGELVDAVGYGGVPKVSVGENGLTLFETKPTVAATNGNSITRTEATGDTDDNSADFQINQTPSPRIFE